MNSTIETRTGQRHDVARWAITLMPLLSLVISDVWAFSPSNHSSITEDGLSSAAITLRGVEYRISPFVRQQMAYANTAIDDCGTAETNTCAGFVPGTSAAHFDDNTIPEGTTSIDLKLKAVLQMVKNIRTTLGNADVATLAAAMRGPRELFGGVLHTIQDFYAHSTWVDRLGAAYQIPWGASFNPGTKSAYEYIFQKSQLGSGNPCSIGAVFGGTGSAPIASEFFLNEEPNAALGRCAHGPSSALTCASVLLTVSDPGDIAACLAGPYSALLDLSANSINGINKDRTGRPGFATARQAAVDSTKVVAASLLKAIGDYDVPALCAFTGNIGYDAATGKCTDVGSGYWLGQLSISTCTPLPSGAYAGIWYAESPCGTAGPVAGSGPGYFYLDDASNDVILGANYGSSNPARDDIRRVLPLAWRSNYSNFDYSVPVWYVQGGTLFYEAVRTVRMHVTTRTATSLSGTLTITTTSGYFTQFPTVKANFVTAQTTASGTWSAILVYGPRPATDMKGFDYCFSNNSAIPQMPQDQGNPSISPSWSNGLVSGGCVFGATR
jgi:hypothetical protein